MKIFLKNFIFVISLLIVNIPAISFAQEKPQIPITSSEKYAGLLIDSKTNEIIYAKNAHLKRHPASLTKMMTLYLTFEALERNRLTMNKRLKVSQKAYNTPYNALGATPDERVTVRDCIHAAIILSSNDATVILAEAIAGSEEKFAKLMTKKAKLLGMRNTNFTNAHGLHDPDQYTTAHDMAKLALALKKKFPKYYSLFSKTSFHFKGNIINGHNHVNKRYEGAEGLKTGYISASGFNLVTAAKKPYGHLVGVVFGGETAKSRDDHMIELLDFGFCHLSHKKGHRNIKCKKQSPLMLVKKTHKPASNIFAFVDPKKPIKVAQLNNKLPSNKSTNITKKSIQPSKFLASNKRRKTAKSKITA